jgi:type IV secretory pathway VirJ component
MITTWITKVRRTVGAKVLLVAGLAAEPMPVVDYPVDHAATEAPLIVLVSGDGGWAEIDQELAKRWQSRGWPVVGVNSLKYFWKARNPAGFAVDLSELIRAYQMRWGARPVVIAGFSFGAVVVPFVGNRFPTDLRAQLKAMVLISPTEYSVLEVKVMSWFGHYSSAGSPGSPVEPELVKLDPLPVLVITGEDDPDAFHDWTERAGLQHEMWSGGHHLDQQYDRLDQAVAVFLKRSIALD